MAQSLARFASCWLLAVLVFFSLAATKLPSYWLPATPAAALLIALTTAAATRSASPARPWRWAWGLSLLLAALLGLGLLAAPLWTGLIQDRDMPTLAVDLLASGLTWRGGLVLLLAAALGALWRQRPLQALVGLQLVLLLLQPLALLPAVDLADRLRAAPVREVAAAIRLAVPGLHQPVAMVGVRRPSLHFYSRRPVLYTTHDAQGLVDLNDRLAHERRPGFQPSPAPVAPPLLVVIDNDTASLPHWRGLAPQQLARAGVFRLWRLDRQRLADRADALMADLDLSPQWQRPRPERF